MSAPSGRRPAPAAQRGRGVRANLYSGIARLRQGTVNSAQETAAGTPGLLASCVAEPGPSGAPPGPQ
ncbi:hypothetical protein SCOCK_240118 [Actinacidiphila cocklensis]|uniref:Uncharacterized protein n=1 Tax=Actinacidiphila cocklensis TaxID=887465 RepID=A0A9W4DV86_9ACTN|nr:hypothetical protein SCOCK_240118 [Actinacidiphila cocklensis]